MSGWVEPPPMESQLHYGDLKVADLRQVFPHQGTWFAEYDLSIAPGQGTIQDELLAYIEFCEEFHRRIADGQDHNFEEFGRFVPISDTTSWDACLSNGTSVPMEGRMWFADGQVSWQHPETEPSSEVAANEFWKRNAQ